MIPVIIDIIIQLTFLFHLTNTLDESVQLYSVQVEKRPLLKRCFMHEM